MVVEGQRSVAGELGEESQLGQRHGQPAGQAVEEARRRCRGSGQVDGHHVRAPGGRRSASPCDRPEEGRRQAGRRRRRRARHRRGPARHGCGRPRPGWSPCGCESSMASLSESTSPRCAASDSAAVSCWAAAARRWWARSLMRSRMDSAAFPCHGTASACATRRAARARMSPPCSRSWATRLRPAAVSPYMDHTPSLRGCLPSTRPGQTLARPGSGCRRMVGATFSHR